MESIQEKFSKCLYREVYESLSKDGFKFTLNNIVSMFHKVSSFELYVFLMYAISQNETVEKHITICESLLYMDPYIVGTPELVYWHVNQALKIKPKDIKVMSWVIDVFYGDPSSPFSDEELYQYALFVNKTVPNNIRALEIIQQF